MAGKRRRPFDLPAILDKRGVSRTLVEFRRNEIIVSQGEPATHVIYIQRGGVRRLIVLDTGREAVIAILGPGEFFGESCLVGQPFWTATAATIMRTTVLMIEKKEMIRLLRVERALSTRFIAFLLARNIKIEGDVVDHLFNSIERRLARALLVLARYGERDRPDKTLPRLSHDRLAEMVGTTRARVHALMKKFRQKGFIEYDAANRKLRINPSLLTIVLED